ncbi:MAG: hypothetical protein F6K14_24515 [Symploca sp. SIO2C1]|nr:hypothetical protein [Symploca sp. SIO2C1]
MLLKPELDGVFKVLSQCYRTCDPTNSFNPGIGKMSRCKHYV